MSSPRPKCLMIIDDDADDREIFSESVGLAGADLRCIQARNGQEGLSKLLQSTELPDYVFVDVNMPVMTGFEVLTKIRSHDKLRNLKVIMYTTSSQRSAIDTAKSLGADGFLTKPEEVGTLVDYITRLVNAGGSTLSAQLWLLAIAALIAVAL